MQRPEFVDREDEARDLPRLADSGQKQLGILYGRRQVGKTYLLEQAWGDRRVFYFLLAAAAPSQPAGIIARPLDLERHNLRSGGLSAIPGVPSFGP